MPDLDRFLGDVAFLAVVGLIMVIVFARRRRVSARPMLTYLYPAIVGWMVFASSTQLFISDSRTQRALFVGLVILGLVLFNLRPVKRWFQGRMQEASFQQQFRALERTPRPR